MFEFYHAELEAAFSEKTKAILVNSPHNPTGKVFALEDLQFIADLCQKWNVYAILDEVSRFDDRSKVSLHHSPGVEYPSTSICGHCCFSRLKRGPVHS